MDQEIPTVGKLVTLRYTFLCSVLDMLRARKKKTSVRRARRTKRRHKEKDLKDTGMGGAASSQKDDPPNQENPTSLQCPKCSSFLKPAVVPAGCTTSLLQCPRCSVTPLCARCLYPCPNGTCTNQSCHVVSLLLTCDRVTNSDSNVNGCPVFRACPKCHSIMMHELGCKYVSCAQCQHSYCFICLRIKQECVKDKNKYWSLICSAPTAARQRFQT